MSSTVTLYATESAVVKQDYPGQNFSSGTRENLKYYQNSDTSDLMYVKFEDVNAQYLYKVIESCQAYVYVIPDVVANISAKPSSETFDESTITYNSAPDAFAKTSFWSQSGTLFSAGFASPSPLVPIKSLLENGLVVGLPYTSSVNDGVQVDTSRSSNRPYLTVTFSDQNAALSLSNLSPTDGYMSRNSPITCKWKSNSAGCLGTLTQTSAVFRYRASSGSSATEIQLTSEQSYTLPVGAITTTSFQWQVEVTSNIGTVTTSDWFTINTQEALPVATAISPKNIVVDGSTPVIFTWSHEISTGTAQTKADLQISANDAQWSSLATVNGAANTYTAPANTLSSGTLYWRVRTYNTDGAASEWSAPLSFIVVAAPEKPVISTNQEPHLIVSWQAEGQQAYQVQIGDYDSGVQYGVEKQFTYPDYLADGIHVIKVRVQNSYGMFSEWAIAEVSITNIPGAPIVLTGQSDNTTILNWTASDYDAYNIYRDGHLIGATEQQQFIDQFVTNGIHQYTVRGVYNDSGYYGDSDTLNINAIINNLMLFNLSSRQWLDIPMSRKSGGTTVSVDLDVNYAHYSGDELPSAEIGNARDRSYDIAPVILFNRPLDANAFESMLGKLVYLKDAYGTGMFGILSSYAVVINKYRRMYSARVREVAVDEVTLNG